MRLECNTEIRVDGVVVNSGHNILTTLAKASFAARMLAAGEIVKYIALGTGDSPEDAADLTLEAESTGNGSDRVEGTTSVDTVYGTDDTTVIVTTYNLTGTFTFKEMGLFDALTDGVLYARRTFTPITVNEGQQIIVTWRITFV